MWQRIIYAEWAEVVPYLAFFLTFGVFLILALRALLMRRAQAERLANLPLEEPSVTESPKNRFIQDD